MSHTQDEKICRLKPIVVLQRLSVEEVGTLSLSIIWSFDQIWTYVMQSTFCPY